MIPMRMHMHMRTQHEHARTGEPERARKYTRVTTAHATITLNQHCARSPAHHKYNSLGIKTLHEGR